jgi:hypothetical protein
MPTRKKSKAAKSVAKARRATKARARQFFAEPARKLARTRVVRKARAAAKAAKSTAKPKRGSRKSAARELLSEIGSVGRDIGQRVRRAL